MYEMIREDYSHSGLTPALNEHLDLYGSNGIQRGSPGNAFSADMTMPSHLSYSRSTPLGIPGVDAMASIRNGNAAPVATNDGPAQPMTPVESKPRVARPPKIRRRTKALKPDKGDGPTINAPLSKLTKDMSHIPIKDMEAWVNRSAEMRRKEVEQKNGKIARPMNSFMLYRSAYAERTKEWCAQNNHQVVSRASGQSWPLEPREVRDLYERYATTERDNHHKAHPGYKFAPNKTQNTPKKKRSHDEISEVDDQEFDVTSCPRSLSARKRARGLNGDGHGHRSRTSTPADHDSSYDSRHSTPMGHNSVGELYMNSDANRSSWEMINPGKPVPGMLSPPEQTHYYQPSIHQSLLGPNIEDVTYKKMGIPGGAQFHSPGLGSMPGNAHSDLLHSQPQPQNRASNSMDNAQVDPQLLEFEPPVHTSMPNREPANYGHSVEGWQFNPQLHNQHYIHSSMPSSEPEQFHHTNIGLGVQIPNVAESRGIWNENSQIAPPTGQEFDDWLSGPAVY
ncbi:hypothetical protein FQN57_005154 [Myotisia sp. PD_48]|nr:hypothetical protein FQN57_005154 [Myotisia sp. PD_48]